MNWNQPCCDACWVRMRGERVPVRLVDAYRVEEQCAWCGAMTLSGIYVREHPDNVSFPAKEQA